MVSGLVAMTFLFTVQKIKDFYSMLCYHCIAGGCTLHIDLCELTMINVKLARISTISVFC